jgi:hypothetical protein
MQSVKGDGSPNLFGGIHGFSTNAMPPQGDCFMASMLLLVAKIRQIVVGNFMIYRLCTQSESDRYGLCHDYVGGSRDGIAAYPAIEMAGISPAFVLNVPIDSAFIGTLLLRKTYITCGSCL